MQLTFSGSVPDTLVSSRNSATTTDNILLAAFFSVDKDGFLATKWQHVNHSVEWCGVTATTIKIIAGSDDSVQTNAKHLIEAVGNHPDIIAGSNNGDGYDYKPECRYFEVNVHGSSAALFTIRRFSR